MQPTTRAYFQLLQRALAFGRGFFWGGKKRAVLLFRPIFGKFRFLVVTLVNFSSNLNKFERNTKKIKKINEKNPKKTQKLKKLN